MLHHRTRRRDYKRPCAEKTLVDEYNDNLIVILISIIIIIIITFLLLNVAPSNSIQQDLIPYLILNINISTVQQQQQQQQH
jgi:uncharacterized membrane protein YcaP (DUF421 family)